MDQFWPHIFRSQVSGITWPAPVAGLASELLAVLYQYEQSQWWPSARLQDMQFSQLGNLVRHAAENVPFYRDRFRAARLDPNRPLTAKSWGRLSALTRQEVQRHEAELKARTYPKDHGPTAVAASGGSTGQPVRVTKTGIDAIFWNANQVRGERWHRDKPDGHILRIRGNNPPTANEAERAAVMSAQGLRYPEWGPPCSLLWKTGPITLIDGYRPAASQADVIRRVRPDYLSIYPASLRLLIAHCRTAGTRFPSLRSIWTLSEVVDDALRDACQEVLGVPIVHDYSAAETGYIALQCPEHRHFHVMSETILVEVVDDAGEPCAAGETGRVLVTPLHNFAMPLLRYEIGDRATVGPPCPCGRGLPVLSAVVGRSTDLLTLPDGRTRRTDMNHYKLSLITAITEFQIVQRSTERIEIRLVLNRPLTPDEDAQLHAIALAEFGPELQIDVTVVDSIARAPSGKLRTFVSLLNTPR
ncbi:MAG: hypothetical protein U1E70_02120 [Acetobacteraceae bacterium]